MNSLRDSACEYALRGWKIFPCWPRSKAPHSVLVPRGHLEASSYTPDALYHWSRCPNANIGLSCRDSGLLVLDVDPRNGGDESLWELEQDTGIDTLSAETPTGGAHYFFKHPGGDFKKELAPGIDIKDRGYVLLPPSIREMGGYVWDREVEIDELPQKWLDIATIASPQRPQNRVLTPSNDPLLMIPSETYAEVLTGRSTAGGWMQCPWHKEGQERTPSLKLDGTIWCCFVCEPLMGKERMGGNVLDFAGRLWNYALPLRGADVQEVKDRLEGIFG